MKAPENSVLDFILSKKVILVEGDAEYILMEAFYKKETGTEPEKDNVHILSVGGTSFPRYLDIAKLHGIKTAVIRDNDKKYDENCVNRYSIYTKGSESICIYADSDNDRHTFEICLYLDNKSICDEIFGEGRRTLTVQEYMLGNKTEAAFQLLLKKGRDLKPPEYIKKAIKWIRE